MLHSVVDAVKTEGRDFATTSFEENATASSRRCERRANRVIHDQTTQKA